MNDVEHHRGRLTVREQQARGRGGVGLGVEVERLADLALDGAALDRGTDGGQGHAAALGERRVRLESLKAPS